jgi:hypothetical protein
VLSSRDEFLPGPAHFDQVSHALDLFETENDGLGHLFEEERGNSSGQDNGPAVYLTTQFSQGAITAGTERPGHKVLDGLLTIGRLPKKRESG